MASTSTQKATSSSYPPPQWMYDVFLSFRGEDTRNNFTGHLYSNLVQGGIDVYMDDTELERGKTIEPALWQAIEESRFSIVVFSRNYASSPWCLDELVKIVQCMKEMGHTALPVFYDVDPSEVANQSTGDYKKAFIEHQEKFSENPDKVQSWSDCLSTVANLAGWDVQNRDESQSIKRILDWIQSKLSFTLPSISKNLVGIDSRLKVLNDYMDEKTNDILFIGISGMGGMGKTTVARVMYDRIRWQFEGSCFLANVREVFAEKDGPSRLQEQLLLEITMELPTARDSSRRINLIKRRLRLKKVLLIFDDVDDEEQLQMLAAEHGSFGPGSRIIITSRDEHVLNSHGVTRIYQTKELSDEDALKLFSWKAFKRDQPDEDLWDLSKQVVGYANGLPLALEVIGSFLHKRDIRAWKSAIDRMKYIPERKIIDVLRISFDGLNVSEQKIFLDIACFLMGMKKDRIIRLLDSCGYHADIGMDVLMEKSLINVSRDEISMHNLLQQMGEDIVRRESPEEPGSRSRLYVYKDVCDALKDNTGKIETIFLDMPTAKEAQWSIKAFSKMTKLRLLKIHNVDVSEGPEYLSNELRFLEWHAYPSKSLPTCFQPDELVELYMSCSSIEQLWDGCKTSVNLKIINLSNSFYLTNTPDFTGIPNLESLILEGCASLSEVHPSFGRHSKLQFVNLVNCISLKTLPSNLEMESLKAFNLNGCSKLDKFPEIVGNMNYLRELRLDETAIVELPSSFHRLLGLVLLSMSSCKNLQSIPSGISGLKSLKKLDVSDCSELKNIPENLGKVESLEEFDANGTSIRQPPASFFLLKNLKVLSFNGCKRLTVNLTDQVLPSLSGLCSLEKLDLCACNLGEGAVPEDIGFLSSLRSLNLSKNNFVSLPKSINQLSRLEKLALKDCMMLESLPEVPLNVQKVKLDGCLRIKEIPDPIKLSSMKRSEFKCLNCWELYKHNGQNNLGLSMLKKYLQGSLPRPGFGIAIPGNDVLDWFNHQSKESSIRVQIPRNEWMGFAACVAFSAYGKSPLFCHFKVDGKESYPSPMYIGCNSMQAVSDHLWLFYLSFDYLKERKNEAFNNLELSFHSYEPGVKVKNCGVRLVNSPSTTSWQSHAGHLIVASKEAASSYIYSLAKSLSYNQWMHDVFCSIRGVHSSKNLTHLYTALIQKAIIHDSELENLRSIESSLLGEIKESGLSVIIFARDYACSPWWFDELVKIGGFIKEMKPDTVFPVSIVSYYVEQSKVDEGTESYMIVFDKDEEDFGENKEKVQRWMNILTEVTSPSSESSKRFISGLDLANLVVNAGLLQLSCGAIKDLHAETNRNPEFSVRHKLVSQSNCTIIAFATPAISAKDPVLQGGDLVSSFLKRVFVILGCSKNLIKQVQRRINLLQTKRHAIVRQLREDVALLIKAGHENIAFNRAEILFKDENIVAIYELLDGFCEFIITNLSYIRWNKDCPNDINEAVSTLIFASARCGDIPELRGVRKVFGQRYGQRFEKTALELLPGNLVNFQVKERLSILSVPDDVKRSLVDEIAIDYCLRPGILALEYASELQQRKEEEQRENQVQDKDVRNNFSKIEESKREVLDGNDLEGKAIFVDSSSTSHTSSDSINSSIAQQSSLDTLESPTSNKAEKEDNFAGPRSPSKSKSVSLSTEESQVASSDYPTTSKHKEERKMAAASSESLPQFPEDMIVYLDDVEEVQSITEEGSCQDQRIFKFKSSRFLPKTEEVEDDVKHMEQYESGSEKSSSSSSRNRRNSNVKRPRRRSISQDHSSSEDIQCMVYYNKPWKRYTTGRKNRSQLSSKHQKKTAIGKSEETRDAEKRQNQTHCSNHCCLNHPCYSCTNDGRVSHEVPPWTQKRFLTVIHHCHCPTIGESDAEMERHAFPHHPRRKSCEFGASPCDVLTSPDRQRKRNSTSGDVSSANPSSKPTSSLTRKEPKAPFLRAMTMPQERSKHNNRENVERSTSFPTESPIHVHPKLPDCDDIAAKFSALKKEHSKNRHA